MKSPTEWSENPSAEANVYPYSSEMFEYNSTSQNYNGVVDNNLSDRGREPSLWDRVEKQPTAWLSDTSALFSYSSADMSYNSDSDTYNGIIDINRRSPTRWSVA